MFANFCFEDEVLGNGAETLGNAPTVSRLLELLDLSGTPLDDSDSDTLVTCSRLIPVCSNSTCVTVKYQRREQGHLLVLLQ